MPQMKTPGVYINETDALPNSVVEVPTAIAAFIGYTEKAARAGQDLTNIPTRISSLAGFTALFGGPPKIDYNFSLAANGRPAIEPVRKTQFLLYYGLKLFFDNGGTDCWIVSCGSYVDDENNPVTKQASDVTAALNQLKQQPEPAILVVPDAVLFDVDAWGQISRDCLNHCAELKSRITILDVFAGDKRRDHSDADVIKYFRNAIEAGNLSFGTAYYPWVNTSLISAHDADYTKFTSQARAALANYLKAEEPNGPATALLDKLTAADQASDAAASQTHSALTAASPAYKSLMTDLLTAMNLMPPAAAMAGVYARTDNEIGVFKAPANTGIVSVTSPAVSISHEDQEDLNVPLDGKAVNAIRTFTGRGVLVWGARTLDGNNQDWRYINVRRTIIMFEQSIAAACGAYVFAPNTAATWVTVRTMLENFLNNQWQAGALAGATPAEAYTVNVGLGSTMTGNDILDGYMRATVKVAVVRPAEFIVITFQQKMQIS